MAGLGAQQQALQGQDVNQLMGIGGLQQQLLQSTADTDFANRQSLFNAPFQHCLLYTSPSPRDGLLSRMPSSA